MKTYTKWTWIPQDYVWVIGNPKKHAASMFKDFEQNKYWRYNIVINGELVVMGEGNFENLNDAALEATKELLRRIKEFKNTHP